MQDRRGTIIRVLILILGVALFLVAWWYLMEFLWWVAEVIVAW